MNKTIKAENIADWIILKKNLIECQKNLESLKNPKKDLKNFQEERKFSTMTKLILNSTGLSQNNTIIRNMIHLLEISLYSVKNKGIFIIGEQGSGKSVLFTYFFKEICEKVSGGLTTPLLIGNGNISDENKINDAPAILEKDMVLVEEFIDETDANEQPIIGTLKDCMESGTFKKCRKISKKTETTFAFVGNSYLKIQSMEDLLKVTKDIPQKFQDRGLKDRIPFLLPHFKNLFGEVKYVENDSEVISVKHLQEILQELRNIPENKIYICEEMGISRGREFNIYNSFISGLCKIFYCEKDVPKWFICGWLEFLKFFRSILIGENIHNPFNKHSARLIVEMLDYSIEEIDYVTFDENRILIKFNNKNELYKIALTGFGREDNKVEYIFYKENMLETIAPILSCSKDYTVLIQEIHGNLPFESRIYFDNIKKCNAEKIEKEDENFNNLMLEKIEKNAIEGKKFSEEQLRFRGIPKFYEIIVLDIIKETFGYKKSREICLNDFSFTSNEIRVINISKYI